MFLRADESEVESNGKSGKAPRVCAFAVATARQPVRGSDLVFFTLSGRAWCCSGTSVMGPVWLCPSWCPVVCFFLGFPLMRGHGEGFRRRLYESVIAGGCRVLDLDLATVLECDYLFCEWEQRKISFYYDELSGSMCCSLPWSTMTR